MAGYRTPRVADYGDLRELTAADFGFLHGAAEPTLAQISPPIGNGEPPDIVVNPPDITVNPPDITVNPPDVNIEVPTGGPPTITEISAPGGGGAGAAGGGAGGGGDLPITGFPAALVGAVGSGLTAAGIALRRIAGRR